MLWSGAERVLGGRDTRGSGVELEGAMAIGIASAGATAVMGGILPSGAVALGALSAIPRAGPSAVERAAAALRVTDGTILHTVLVGTLTGPDGPKDLQIETWQVSSPPHDQLQIVTAGSRRFEVAMVDGVGQLYDDKDTRREAGFSFFYMGINVGAFLAPLVCGWLSQSASWQQRLESWGMDPRNSWHWGFGAAAVGMFFGLVQYVLTGKRIAKLLPYRAGAVADDRRGLDEHQRLAQKLHM